MTKIERLIDYMYKLKTIEKDANEKTKTYIDQQVSKMGVVISQTLLTILATKKKGGELNDETTNSSPTKGVPRN